MSSIGDVIHTLPVAELLKRRFPKARISWVAEKNIAPLLRHHPSIDQLLLVDTRQWRKRCFTPAVWKEIWSFLKYIRSQKFDVVIDFQGLFKSAVLAAISRSPRRIGMARRDRREKWSSIFLNELTQATEDKRHIIEKNLAVLSKLGISETKEPLNFHVHASREAIGYVDQELSKLDMNQFVLVNPGGGWLTKMWELDKFAQLIDCIHSDLGIPAVITWGPGEKHLAEKISRKCLSPARVSFSTNLAQLVALIRRSRLMVSGDSGPLHVASALGVPVVGLFGPTDPLRNGPWNPHDSGYTIHYECSPCYLRVCPIGIQCMKRMEVAAVLNAVKKTFTLSASLSQNH